MLFPLTLRAKVLVGGIYLQGNGMPEKARKSEHWNVPLKLPYLKSYTETFWPDWRRRMDKLLSFLGICKKRELLKLAKKQSELWLEKEERFNPHSLRCREKCRQKAENYARSETAF